MSEYVYIAKANDSNAPSAILRPLLYHLSIARSIDNALTTIERYWPTVRMEQIWNVRADNRADMLWRYLELRYRARLFKPAWYQFTDSDLALIKSITDENFVNFLPECSPTITPVKPGEHPAELEARRAALLEGMTP